MFTSLYNVYKYLFYASYSILYVIGYKNITELKNACNLNAQALYYSQEVREKKTKNKNLLESVNIMTINVSMKTKSLSINVFTSINFDDIDFDKSMIFVWNNDVIVGSVVIPMNEDVYIDFWINDREYKSFDNYQDFRKFYNKKYKNLVK